MNAARLSASPVFKEPAACNTAGDATLASARKRRPTSMMEFKTPALRGDSSVWRWRRMCFRALCTIFETESLWMGTVAAGSVSLDKAELMSLFSAQRRHVRTGAGVRAVKRRSVIFDLCPLLRSILSLESLPWSLFYSTA